MASADEPPLYLDEASAQKADWGSRSQSRSRQRPRSGSDSESNSDSMSGSWSRSRPVLPMTPPDTDGDKYPIAASGAVVSRNLDYLVHKLNRKPIMQDSIRWHFLRKEEQVQAQVHPTEPLAPLTRIAAQPLEPTPTLEPLSKPTTGYDLNPSTSPTAQEILLPPAGIQSHSQAAYPPTDPAEDIRLPKTNDIRRPRRATESRLHKSASNHRMLGLVTDMIEKGVQCHVQTSTPPSPARASSTTHAHIHRDEVDVPSDPEKSPSRMELEVDVGLGDVEEEPAINDIFALRNASSPAGISKFGVLRYRSSSEAAHSCKNMKKAVPRMRRRCRTNPTPATGSSAPERPSATC
ncbi:hypothetical protein GGS20DRAFT_37075 [Poronia punctata]|nr:hypothetical protein GGS20DRAFT_37075 [Poronia punctata]